MFPLEISIERNIALRNSQNLCKLASILLGKFYALWGMSVFETGNLIHGIS
jgi:hypothetical protein